MFWRYDEIKAMQYDIIIKASTLYPDWSITRKGTPGMGIPRVVTLRLGTFEMGAPRMGTIVFQSSAMYDCSRAIT